MVIVKVKAQHVIVIILTVMSLAQQEIRMIVLRRAQMVIKILV